MHKVMETQELINLAQYKLNKCAETSIKNKHIFNLRVLVGHANLLDDLLYYKDQLNNEMDNSSYVYNSSFNNYSDCNDNSYTTSYIGSNGCIVSSKLRDDTINYIDESEEEDGDDDDDKLSNRRTTGWYATNRCIQENFEEVIVSDSDSDSDFDSGFDSDNSGEYNSDGEDDDDDDDIHFYSYNDIKNTNEVSQSFVTLTRQNSAETFIVRN